MSHKPLICILLIPVDQCLDVKAGSKHTLSSKPFPTLEDVQTWQCSGDDAQQIFTANV